MTEEWRPVPGFPNYEVSDLGNVRSLFTNRVLSGWHIKGYPSVKLYPEKKTKMIHTLTAEAFLGPCPLGQEVRHRDGTRNNGRLTNLEYGTRQENVLDAYIHGSRNFDADCAKAKKSRDTKDRRYGRKNWTNLQRAGVKYSKVFDL